MCEAEKPEKLAEAKVEVKHPLENFYPETFASFERWFERWNGTAVQSERLGLLHSLLEEDKGFPLGCEGISFLLEVADSYQHMDDFRYKPDSYCDRETVIRNREKIARKAFAVLCGIFFKGPSRDWEQPCWWWALRHTELVKKILWFVRPEREGLRNFRLYDVEGDHHQKVFRDFLEEFAKLGWEYRSASHRFDRSLSLETEALLIEARPQLIIVLNALRMLRWLNGDNDYISRKRELDKASTEMLEHLALEREYCRLPELDVKSYGKSRKPRNLEEAALAGSVAAEVLIMRRIHERTEALIKTEYEASRRQQEAEEHRKRLERLEEQKKELEQEQARLLSEG